MPKIRVCRLCGVVSSVARLLPCTHVLCESCEAQVADRGRPQCPIDGAAFEREQVTTMPFAKRDLGEYHVRCINDDVDVSDGTDGCTFIGKLAALEEHYLAHCVHGRVRCSKCGRSVFRKDIVDHYVDCAGAEMDTSPVEPVDDGKVIIDAAEAKRLAGTLKDLQHGLKDASLGTPMATANFASLRRKAVSLGDFLSVLDPDQTDVPRHDSWCGSEAGSSTICRFRGIEAMRKSGETTLALEEPCRLLGYTFTLACKFERSRGKLSSVSFLFALRSGERDDFVEWPFARRVKLSMLHPKKQGKDVPVELKICQEKHAQSLRRPQPDDPQNGILSEKITWKYVEKKELVGDDCLLVAVEFE
ncbi:uncharacterized protein LOC119406443 [Rhipicephalus sanguineus]|nr:uncharacterized protein LOC119406443 [Rhipicephalus sanguineus]